MRSFLWDAWPGLWLGNNTMSVLIFWTSQQTRKKGEIESYWISALAFSEKKLLLGEASLFVAVDPQGFQLIGTGCQVNDLPSINNYGGTNWVFPSSDKESKPYCAHWDQYRWWYSWCRRAVRCDPIWDPRVMWLALKNAPFLAAIRLARMGNL